jgi:predicted ATPase/DNA-binding CsgD family transcriptional regulator/transcriptional regulator with XRE-family HTH domain
MVRARRRIGTVGAVGAAEPFGATLQRLRLAAGLSQEELAERAGLSQRGISDLERGVRRSPYPGTARRLADALGLEAAERARLLAARGAEPPPGPAAEADRARPPSPPMAPDSRAAATPRRLPAQAAPLVGRASELEAIRRWLLHDGVRLLTLVGTGGTGKTRLAVAAAHELVDAFIDGAWFVDLAPVSAPPGVLQSTARVLGLRAAESALDEVLHSYLRDKRLLLVLDNFEHVLAAAPAVAHLVDSCPDLVVLTTSREPLRLRWERLCPIGPLDVPESGIDHAPEELARTPSVALFLQRAREVRPDFELDVRNAASVAELCRRLDGLPLALELAAARVRALPPSAILGRIERRLDLLVGGRRDEPPRHHTIRAALDWSHDLLAPSERLLFRRLSAFVGGCTLEAAEAVCGPDLELDVLAGLESLLDRSLVKQDESAGEPRFGMLETVRAYASEALDAGGDADVVRLRHATYYVELAELARLELRGPRQMAWLARLDRELANIRAALQWLTSRAHAGEGAAQAAELGLRLGGAIWWYMHVRGLYAEVRELLLPLLGAPAAQHAPARARALGTVGVAAWGLGEFDAARACQAQRLALARAPGDEAEAGQAHVDLACLAISQGAAPTAEAECASALEIARAIGDEWMLAWAFTFQGLLAIAQHDLPRAADRFEAAARLRVRLGDAFGQAWASYGLASVAALRGQRAVARPLYEEALATFRALGERPTVASILDALGALDLVRGDLAAARTRFGDSLSTYREMASQRGVGIALSGFAAVDAAEGATERAVRLAAAAASLREAGGSALELIAATGTDPRLWLERARRKLGEATFAAAWSSGQTLPADAAVREALAGAPAAESSARAGGVRHARDMPLTPREQEVARLVAEGASNRQIAETLVIGERTAETHISNILAKLGLQTRVQLAAWAVARGLHP